ncbi:hypothetical protein RQP46_002634 [Phenoliferia psychrophenolica]
MDPESQATEKEPTPWTLGTRIVCIAFLLFAAMLDFGVSKEDRLAAIELRKNGTRSFFGIDYDSGAYGELSSKQDGFTPADAREIDHHMFALVVCNIAFYFRKCS